ncbi:MAG: hypothetical protein COT85_02195 [Chlamydiae bacterium CG10_big_fil_rev_8_21_14_0_10_42_34]|nr:MAG: hypothetical protein COT85_02195 [Chlamydiae bacterium CG10_big_fil_rev_8_21_14_0_10_42_34]
MTKLFFWGVLLCLFSLFADKANFSPSLELPSEIQIQTPWLTGPLFAPSGTTIPAGHYNIEPYVFALANTANYDSNWGTKDMQTFWGNYTQTSIQVGLNKWLDCQINPTIYYNVTKGAAQWAIGDMPVGFDIQLYRSGVKLTDWIHSVKLILLETIPIGNYQKLNPNKLKTDVGGAGSWQTAIGLAWGNLWYIGNKHFYTARFTCQYTLPSPVSVKGVNAYGGGAQTKGTVYPAQKFQVDIGMEFTLTQNWVLAMDLIGAWFGETRFKGETFVSNTAPPGAQFSIAPAIEYNWNENVGIVFGPWFTISGRNALQFRSGVIAFNYYK